MNACCAMQATRGVLRARFLRPCFATSVPISSSTALLCNRSKFDSLHTKHCKWYVTKQRRVVRASIEQEVSEQLKQALKDRDAARLRALRGIRAAFLVALKEDGSSQTLSDEKAIKQLKKLAKMRKESIEMFKAGGRTDLADAEHAELLIIQSWLPALANEQQTREWAQQAIEKTGATKPSEVGKVIGAVMKDHKADVDGALLRTVVTEMLK